MNVSPNILAKNYDFKKIRYSFVDERPMITKNLIYFTVTRKPLYVLFAKGKT